MDKTDTTLALVARYVVKDWPKEPPAEVAKYVRLQDELSLQSGCVLQGSLVVVPDKGGKTASGSSL